MRYFDVQPKYFTNPTKLYNQSNANWTKFNNDNRPGLRIIHWTAMFASSGSDRPHTMIRKWSRLKTTIGQVSQHILFLLRFLTENIEYDPESQNTILDYKVEVRTVFSVYILGNPIETKFLKLHFWESFCTKFFLRWLLWTRMTQCCCTETWATTPLEASSSNLRQEIIYKIQIKKWWKIYSGFYCWYKLEILPLIKLS